MLSSRVILAQHSCQPLAPFFAPIPTCPERARGILHSLSPVLLTHHHCPPTRPDPVGVPFHHCFNSFTCNTYEPPRKCCKQKTYVLAKPFRCNTYKNTGRATPTVDSQLLLALHSSDGNTAAAFTLDGKTGPHDAHRCWEHGSGIFAQSSRQQGIFAQHPAGARPRGRRFFQDLLPRLPIHFPFPRTPPQTLWRRCRKFSRNLSGRHARHPEFCQGIRRDLPAASDRKSTRLNSSHT